MALEHHNNLCEIAAMGRRVDDYQCSSEGCPSTCIDLTADLDPLCSGPASPVLGCSLLRGVRCSSCGDLNSEQECEVRPSCAWANDQCAHTCDGRDQASCDSVAECTWTSQTCIASTVAEAADDAFCDTVMGGAQCVNGSCRKPCADDADCALGVGPVDGVCVAPTLSGTDLCSPQNNECYATQAAEIWDPSCGADAASWTALGEESEERMYHSVALLLPDSRVISTGGGHVDFNYITLEEKRNAQYFECSIPSWKRAAEADCPALIA